MESELLVAYIILGFAGCAVLIAFFCWRIFKSSEGTKKPDIEGVPPPPAALWPPGLRWLVLLTSCTAALLVLQLVLGYLTHALVLVADAAHGAADCATYFLAAFLEFLKHSFGTKAVTPLVIGRLDRASACFSIVVVLTNSVVVAIEAGMQVSAGSEHQRGEAHLGAAMLIIACLGLAMNLSLLLLSVWMHHGHASETLTSDSETSPRSRSPRKKRDRLRCLPGPPEKLSLHGAFHPGCQGTCSTGTGPNLNLYGVILHVGTDVLRTLLMLVVGALVQCRVLGSNLAKVDAICAFAVCGCVLLGSVYLVRSAIVGASNDNTSPTLRATAALPPSLYGATR